MAVAKFVQICTGAIDRYHDSADDYIRDYDVFALDENGNVYRYREGGIYEPAWVLLSQTRVGS